MGVWVCVGVWGVGWGDARLTHCNLKNCIQYAQFIDRAMYTYLYTQTRYLTLFRKHSRALMIFAYSYTKVE